MERRRILVQGIGGIGGIVAAGLIRKGYAVTLITGNEKITEAVNKRGIRVQRGDHEVEFYTTAHTSISALPKKVKYDVSMMIMKANDLEQACIETLPYLADKGYFATFQNGIVEPMVRGVAGENRVVPVTVSFGGTMVKPGLYEKTSHGGFHTGEWDGTKSRRIADLKILLESVDSVEVSSNMQGVLWSKLAINSTINTLGAITGQTLGELLKSKEARKLFLDIYAEVVDVAHSKGIRLETVAADPYRLYRSKDAGWLTRFVKDIFVRVVGRKYRDVKSSTLQSVERGRKSEIDYLNGFVADQAGDVDVTVNIAVTQVMRMIDSGDLSPAPSNLDIVLKRAS